MFYIITIMDSGEKLTYTFHPETSSKTGNDGLGISIFATALKDYYSTFRNSVTMTIMNSRGEYLHTDGTYKQISMQTYKEWKIPLTKTAKQEVEEYHAIQKHRSNL